MYQRSLCSGISFFFLLALVPACGNLAEQGDLDALTHAGSRAARLLPADLVGTYAEEIRVATIAKTPLGDNNTLSITYGLAEVTLEGEQLIMSSIACHSDVLTDGPISSFVEDEAVRSLAPVVGPLTLSKEEDTAVLVREEVAAGVGVRLADPMLDPLPESAHDPLVWDQDGDGNPGVSVNVSGFVSGQIYVVRRLRYAWQATQDPEGRLVGLVVDRSEQRTVGASNWMLDRQVETIADPDPSKNSYTAVKLADVHDCDSLMAAKEVIFAETAPR